MYEGRAMDAPEPLTLCLPPSVSAKVTHCGHWYHFPHLLGRKLVVTRQLSPTRGGYFGASCSTQWTGLTQSHSCLHDLQSLVAFAPQGACYICSLGLKESGVCVQCIGPKGDSLVQERILCKWEFFSSPLGHWGTLFYNPNYVPLQHVTYFTGFRTCIIARITHPVFPTFGVCWTYPWWVLISFSSSPWEETCCTKASFPQISRIIWSKLYPVDWFNSESLPAFMNFSFWWLCTAGCLLHSLSRLESIWCLCSI